MAMDHQTRSGAMENVEGFEYRDQILNVIDTLSNKYLQGKSRVLKLSTVALLTGGHLLLEDIPGLGKTTLALALARALGLSFGRIQCTSDLLPSDITGLSIFNRQESRFVFSKGPIFNNVILVDEINRAMPKTQSAMLEAMEERRVTVEGVTHLLPEPFLVIATQNPVEQVGTYPLPESQLDRFNVRTGIGYPAEEVEKEIIRYGSIRDDILHIPVLVGGNTILAARDEVRQKVNFSRKVTDYLFEIIAATRRHPQIVAGISTRGGINMVEASRAWAYLEGRNYVMPEDVRDVALPVAAHRLVCWLEYEGVDKEEILGSILSTISIPLA